MAAYTMSVRVRIEEPQASIFRAIGRAKGIPGRDAAREWASGVLAYRLDTFATDGDGTLSAEEIARVVARAAARAQKARRSV